MLMICNRKNVEICVMKQCPHRIPHKKYEWCKIKCGWQTGGHLCVPAKVKAKKKKKVLSLIGRVLEWRLVHRRGDFQNNP